MHLNSDNVGAVLPKFLLPVVARINGEWEPSGSAVLVSRHGFLLAARHVIEPAAKKRGRMVGRDGKFTDEGKFFALFFDSQGDNPGAFCARFLSIERTTLPDRGDVAFCQLRWPPPNAVLEDLSPMRISPSPPRIGERVFIFGYDKLDLPVVSETEDVLHVNCNAQACAVRGTVKELHIPAKDPVLAPFPSFTVDVETEVASGMSGGPVINESGYVCGLVSRSPSWELSATCAMLTLSMGMRIEVLARPGLEARSSHLLELLRDGLIQSDGSWRDVELRETAEGTDVFLAGDES